MTVKELIEELKKQPEDAIVISTADEGEVIRFTKVKETDNNDVFDPNYLEEMPKTIFLVWEKCYHINEVI